MFAGFPIPIAGKTGTAEKGLGQADQSWYAAITYPNPKYVWSRPTRPAASAPRRAAPMARQILAALST